MSASLQETASSTPAPAWQFSIRGLLAWTALFSVYLLAWRYVDSAYITDGNYLWLAAVVVFAIATGFSALLWWNREARGVVILPMAVIFLICYRQHHQLSRLHGIQAEVLRVVEYAEARRVQDGTYPGDLSSYTFANDAYQPLIEYSAEDGLIAIEYRLWPEEEMLRNYSPATGWRTVDPE